MKISLAGKIALVTGSTRGIGAAIAIDMTKAGAKVVLHGRSEEKVKEVKREIEGFGGECIEILADLGNPEVIDKIFDEINSIWGNVDILVNNAGVENRKSSLDFSQDEYDWIMDVNLKSAFFLAQKALKPMKEAGWGRIINISSLHEIQPTGFCSVYSMSKGGMMMMTRELAYEFSKFDITVNNIAPGAIRTDMNREVLANPEYEKKVTEKIPARFIGVPEDISKASVFLASEEARYITGASLFIDGGLVM